MGDSGTVSVTNNNKLSTAGEDSHGILAQAIGGGGENSSKSLASVYWWKMRPVVAQVVMLP